MNLQRISIKMIHGNTGQIPGVPRNPRTIKDGKFEKLKKSLKEHSGMLELRELVAYDAGEKGLVVLGGNMRLSALKELGEESALVKVLPPDTPLEELRHFVINDNSSYGDWDAEALGAEWDAGELDDWGMDGWAEESPEETKGDDDAPELREKSVSEIGELYQLGEHRLICGDSADGETLGRLMGGEKADMVFTDPPYGVSIGDKNK